MDKFSDGSTSGYVELPVPAAWLSWTRGEAKLRALIESDPAQFFGGWKAFVAKKEGELNPELPLPVVTRVSEDGKHSYKVYTANVISFLPIQHRTRFEFQTKVKDEQTEREYKKTVAVSKERIQGYSPSRQVFGLVFGEDNEYKPAVIKVNTWSAFITFNRAGETWNKVKVPVGHALIRRYGSIGNTKSGELMPNFEVVGQARSTPIEAINVQKPRFLKVTPEVDELVDLSVEWRNCERWNASGKVEEPVQDNAMQKFFARCEDMYLTNVEIEQILKENDGDYAVALKAIEEGQALVDLGSAA